MTKDETLAMDLALEALELSSVTVDSFGVQRKTQEAITAIKQARSAPVREPVDTDELTILWMLINAWHDAPAPALHICGKINSYVLALKQPTPPASQRQWVGLSSADRGECLSAGDAHGWIGVMEATEAKLRSKNGY